MGPYVCFVLFGLGIYVLYLRVAGLKTQIKEGSREGVLKYLELKALKEGRANKEQKLNVKTKKTEVPEFQNSADSFVYLMMVSAYFIKSDGKIDSRELEFVNSYLKSVLSPEVAVLGYSILHKALKQDISAIIKDLDLKAKSELSYSTKLNILQFIRGLCVSDIVFSEEKSLKAFSDRLGVDKIDYDQIASLSYNKKLNPSAILEQQKRLQLDDMKIADYLMFKRIWGGTKNDLPTEVIKKTNIIEKEIREKTFDERIDDFKDERIKQQIAVLDKKLHLFLDVLSQKMEPGETTYKKYKKTFEQVYMMALENIKDVVSSQKIIESIDKKALKIELEQLKKQGKKQHVKTKQERLRLFEEETNRLNEILLNNERAIQEMEEVTFKIGRLKGTKGEDQRAIKDAIQDLDEWTDKVKLYNKR